MNPRALLTAPFTTDLTIDQFGYSIFAIDENGNRISGASTSLNWSSNYNAFTSLYGFGSAVTYWITTALFNPSWVGLTGPTPGGIIHFPLGHFLGSQDSASSARRIEMGNAIPTTGKYAAGDIKFKIASGAGDTILGWRCTISGSPGTWETLHITIT